MELLLNPANRVFAFALGLVVLLAALQVVALVLGGSLDLFDADADVDLDLDLDADGDVDVASDAGFLGALGGALDWLGVGSVPLSILITLWAAGFGLCGLILQSAMQSFSGALLPGWLAVGCALFASFPLLKLSGAILRPILPREETEAVSTGTLLGSEGQITVGVARRGRPAEARVHDKWGKAHYVLVEPEQDGAEFPAGSHVLLLKRADHVFRVIAGASAAIEE